MLYVLRIISMMPLKLLKIGIGAIILSLVASTTYYKIKYDNGAKYRVLIEEEARIAKRQVEIIKKQSKRQTELQKEHHELEISRLNSNINSLRKQTSKSILPSVSRTPSNPEEITFTRQGLDRALHDFREGITALVGEGSSCQIDLEMLTHWLDRQRVILDTE
jgi:hypothetical protein